MPYDTDLRARMFEVRRQLLQLTEQASNLASSIEMTLNYLRDLERRHAALVAKHGELSAYEVRQFEVA